MELKDRRRRQGGTRGIVVLLVGGRGAPVRVGEDVGRTASKVEKESEQWPDR
jgi:hypothetical protein